MAEAKQNLIMDLSRQFALKVLLFCNTLSQERHFALKEQLLRSGTSIGANVREAQNAESRRDFIHKLKVAAKEAGETEYWLILCDKSEVLPQPPSEMIKELESIQRVLGKIISTSKNLN